ncbi:hypothetical protein M5G07_04390 [Serratia symbiotica]|nr:hypothetical protein [Serratia symbiotica]
MLVILMGCPPCVSIIQRFEQEEAELRTRYNHAPPENTLNNSRGRQAVTQRHIGREPGTELNCACAGALAEPQG